MQHTALVVQPWTNLARPSLRTLSLIPPISNQSFSLSLLHLRGFPSSFLLLCIVVIGYLLEEIITMQRLSSILTSSTSGIVNRAFLTSVQRATPGDFVKWAFMGFNRTSKFASGFSPLEVKPMNSIMDIHRAMDKSPEDLASIWDDYHLGRGHIGASMKANLYKLFEQSAIDCQYFVIPLWRGSGFTTMFSQVKLPHIIFTGLEDYKARGTQASPFFTVTHYTEFAESKDLVLVRGDVVFASKLTDDEAKWLLETAHSFYLNDVRYKLVERFNKQTRDFEFKDVLQALNMPSL